MGGGYDELFQGREKVLVIFLFPARSFLAGLRLPLAREAAAEEGPRLSRGEAVPEAGPLQDEMALLAAEGDRDGTNAAADSTCTALNAASAGRRRRRLEAGR